VNGLLGDFFGTFLRNRGAAAGLAVLALVGVAAASAGLLFPYSPWDMRGAPFMPPGEMEFLLGSDSLGRDVAAGIAYGARVSLLIGAVSTVVAVLLGITLGAVAGYAGGVVDDESGGVTEALRSKPRVIAVARNHENIDIFGNGAHDLTFRAPMSTDQLHVGMPDPFRGRREQL